MVRLALNDLSYAQQPDKTLAIYILCASGPPSIFKRLLMLRERAVFFSLDRLNPGNQHRDGEIDLYDVIRRYGVICNWGTGELLPNSTRDFRAAMERRSAAHWA